MSLWNKIKNLFTRNVEIVEKPVQKIPKEEPKEERTIPDPILPVISQEDKNLKAFLDVIAFAEGTINRGDDGYNVLVGGRLFDDYSDHPNVIVNLPNLGIASTAAGRYQILNRYWKHYKKTLNLPDFGPDSQDEYAINQIRERRALRDVEEGRISTAIVKCANIWASFPGAGYGQREVPMSKLLKKFEEYGGKLTEE